MAAKHRKTNCSWEKGDARRDPPKTCEVSGKRMYSNEREANATAANRMTDKESAPNTYELINAFIAGHGT